jgi:hypothetical protein
MSDAGETLVDEDSRIQERMHELARERSLARQNAGGDREQAHAIESLRLARVELERQLGRTADEGRRAQLGHAIEEVGRRMMGMVRGRAGAVAQE